jgi:hypothetical protein
MSRFLDWLFPARVALRRAKQMNRALDLLEVAIGMKR